MGILNVTPDSFSDGGDHFEFQKAAMESRLPKKWSQPGRRLWTSVGNLHAKEHWRCPSKKRIVELSSSPGTDALISLRLSAKELAREKLKMLQQCRAEGHKLLDPSKIHQASISLPQLKMGAKLRGPEGLWEVSQVPQASAHFAKLGKAMPKQVRGSKNNQVKASMTESRSLPSISATPSQFGVGAQKQILQARFGEKRSLDR
eukprot:symbB.v1.2.032708.t2/scaffold3962.1/size79057/2